jgi:tRNA(Ile)-lysidine synthase
MLEKYQGKRICVAVSGGEDSVVLLHYLHALKEKCGYSLCAVHCEHGIRGEESVEDMHFVQALCEAWGVELFLFNEDCPARAKREKESLETAARNFRYECFRTLIEEGKADYIATAHHKNDEAETVVFRLARGTSLGGMSAMKAESGYILRPILEWTKGEISAYAQANKLSYRVDKTNFERDATRNKIRLEVLPKLEEAVNGATENIVRFARLAGEDDALLYELSQALICDTEEGCCVAFCDKKPLFTRACLTALKGLGVEKDYTSAHLDSLFALQASHRGARLNLPQGVCAEKREDGLFFYFDCAVYFPEKGQEKNFTEEGFDGGMYEVILVPSLPNDMQAEGKVLRFAVDKLPKDAVFRFRKDGDRIKTFGGTKTLKKFFNEKKLPVWKRAYFPLIAEKDGNTVYAVCGVEISETIKVDESTQRVLYIILRKRGNGDGNA